MEYDIFFAGTESVSPLFKKQLMFSKDRSQELLLLTALLKSLDRPPGDPWSHEQSRAPIGAQIWRLLSGNEVLPSSLFQHYFLCKAQPLVWHL